MNRNRKHMMADGSNADQYPIPDSNQEELLSDVLNRFGAGEEEQERGQHLDIFETGNIWTQVGITQAQRKAWQNGSDVYDEEFEPVDIDGRLKNRIALDSDQESNQDEEEPSLSKDSDLHLNHSQSPSEDAENLASTTQSSQSWWKEGKTAPLLNQYDEERRLWYLAQAGIYDQSESVHDAQARQPARPPLANSEARELSSSPPIVIYQTPARPTPDLPNAFRSDSRFNQTPSHTANGQSRSQAQTHFPPQPIQTITNGVTPQRRGPAISLAGTINTPNGQKRTPIQTPKRKTWQSTWASREEAKAAALAKSNLTKKRRKNSNTPIRSVKRRTGIGDASPATSSSKNATPNRPAGNLAQR